MTKFYVQSGKIKKVIFAADANAAALWLMNTVMDTFYPEQQQCGFDSDPFEVLEDGLMLLGEIVYVSQDGFDQIDERLSTSDWSDASLSTAKNGAGEAEVEEFDALELFNEWNELVLAVAKMEAILSDKASLTNQASRSDSDSESLCAVS